MFEKISSVKELILAGADINKPNRKGKTAINLIFNRELKKEIIDFATEVSLRSLNALIEGLDIEMTPLAEEKNIDDLV